MKVQYFKGHTNLRPESIPHRAHRALLAHASTVASQRGHVHHNAIRVVMINKANSERIALMMAEAERNG